LKQIDAKIVVVFVTLSSAKYIKKKLTENVKNCSHYLENFMQHFLLHKITVCPSPGTNTNTNTHIHIHIHRDYMDMGVACGYLKVD